MTSSFMHSSSSKSMISKASINNSKSKRTLEDGKPCNYGYISRIWTSTTKGNHGRKFMVSANSSISLFESYIISFASIISWLCDIFWIWRIKEEKLQFLAIGWWRSTKQDNWSRTISKLNGIEDFNIGKWFRIIQDEEICRFYEF